MWDKPTAINCIETLANVPVIIRDGAAAFTSVGTPLTGGTKVLTVYDYAPDSEPRVVEIPFGATLRELEQQLLALGHLGSGKSLQRFLEVPPGEAPVVAALETVAELHE